MLIAICSYRNMKAYTYYITNQRVVIERRWFGITYRDITYDKITDVIMDQGFFGRTLGYGTVMPLTAGGASLTPLGYIATRIIVSYWLINIPNPHETYEFLRALVKGKGVPEVEILPEEALEEKPIAERIVAKIEESLTLLDNLKKRLAEGKISEEIYKKLSEEFQEKIAKLKEEAKEEINKIEAEISKEEAERKNMEKSMEEIEARRLIGQIKEEEYERRKNEIEKEKGKIELRISSKKKIMQKLQELV